MGYTSLIRKDDWMNSLDIVGQYGLSNALPILCGVALIKIEKKEKNDINRKQDFITLLDEVV